MATAYRQVNITGDAPLSSWRRINIRRVVSVSDGFSWEVISPAAIEEEAYRQIWINRAVSRSLTVVWAVDGGVGVTLSVPWAIESSSVSAVTNAGAFGWHCDAQNITHHGLVIYSLVDVSAEFQWNIDSQAVSKYAGLGWRMLTSVGASAGIGWNARKSVPAFSSLLWTLESPSASTNLYSDWNLLTRVERNASFEWGLSSGVALPFSASWSMYAAAGKSAGIGWDVTTRPMVRFVAPWNVVQLAQSSLRLEWYLLGEEPIGGNVPTYMFDVEAEDRHTEVYTEDRIADVNSETRAFPIR